MSARAIVSGAVGKAAELRTSKNGNPFATLRFARTSTARRAGGRPSPSRECDRSSQGNFRRRADRSRRRNTLKSTHPPALKVGSIVGSRSTPFCRRASRRLSRQGRPKKATGGQGSRSRRGVTSAAGSTRRTRTAARSPLSPGPCQQQPKSERLSLRRGRISMTTNFNSDSDDTPEASDRVVSIATAKKTRQRAPPWLNGAIKDERGRILPILRNAAMALRAAPELNELVPFRRASAARDCREAASARGRRGAPQYLASQTIDRWRREPGSGMASEYERPEDRARDYGPSNRAACTGAFLSPGA